MPFHDIVVLGASAGGIGALIQVVKDLPSDLPAAIFVVVHFPSESKSLLPRILSRSGLLPAVHPQDEDPIEYGRIYIALPNRHMLLENGKIRIVAGPREHGFRPAIDPLFRSAAMIYGQRVVGIILSGTLGDGATGMQVIEKAGGYTIVQDPQEAVFASMPTAVLQKVNVDMICPLSTIAAQITRLAYGQIDVPVGETMPKNSQKEDDVIQENIKGYEAGQSPDAKSILTCPECGGVIWELHEGDTVRFRCHVGHVYSPDSFFTEQSNDLEAALWTAVRALEERAALLRRLIQMSNARGNSLTEKRFSEQVREAEKHAALIREQVLYRITKPVLQDIEISDKAT